MELDEKLFKDLFYKYYDRVYAGLLAKNGSPSVASELTQITFIKVWEYRASFSFELDAQSQIFKKARQVFIDWLRKEAHQKKLMEKMQQITQTVQHSQLELTNTLQNALSQLPARQRQVFSLAYIEGFSHKEIATALGLSVKTVDRHIYKSLLQLRKVLAYAVVIAVATRF